MRLKRLPITQKIYSILFSTWHNAIVQNFRGVDKDFLGGGDVNFTPLDFFGEIYLCLFVQVDGVKLSAQNGKF